MLDVNHSGKIPANQLAASLTAMSPNAHPEIQVIHPPGARWLLAQVPPPFQSQCSPPPSFSFRPSGHSVLPIYPPPRPVSCAARFLSLGHTSSFSCLRLFASFDPLSSPSSLFCAFPPSPALPHALFYVSLPALHVSLCHSSNSLCPPLVPPSTAFYPLSTLAFRRQTAFCILIAYLSWGLCSKQLRLGLARMGPSILTISAS